MIELVVSIYGLVSLEVCVCVCVCVCVGGGGGGGGGYIL